MSLETVLLLLCFLCVTAILCCLVTILAISVPLFDKEERQKASTYNLYLVFLAIPDLVLNCTIFVNAERQSHSVQLALARSTSFFASVWMSDVILYELLKLLEDSKRRRRSRPPSLQKATLQAVAVYAVSSFFHALLFLLAIHSYHGLITAIKVAIVLGVIGFSSLFYPVWVLFRIYREDLLSYTSDAMIRLKVLVLYFFRIISVNIITSIVHFVRPFLYAPQLGISFVDFWFAIQVWIGFGFSLTKPDVLEYVRRLFCPCYGARLELCRDIDIDDDNDNAAAAAGIGDDDDEPSETASHSYPDETEGETHHPGDDDGIAAESHCENHRKTPTTRQERCLELCRI